MAIAKAFFPGLFVLLVVGVLFLIPEAAHAALVPQCVLSGGLGCQACDLFILINTLIQFAIYFAVTIATVLFMYAGYLYLTSGGSTENVTKANTIFKDVFFGMVLALLGFVIVDTIVKTVASGGSAFQGPWTTLKCVGTNVPGGRQVGGPGLVFTNPYGNVAVSPEGLGITTDPAVYNGNVPVEVATLGNGACSPDALAPTFGSNASMMSCVCSNESGSRPAYDSAYDKMNNDPQKRIFSAGLFALNMTAMNDIWDCEAQKSLDCQSAFNGRNWAATVKPDKEELYARCRQVLEDAKCNIYNARRIATQAVPGPGLGAWGNCKNHKACGVPFNPGYDNGVCN